MKTDFIEIDGIVIEVRNYGQEQLCRVNPNRKPDLIKTWISTDATGMTYEQLLSYLVTREQAPAPAESTHRISLR